MHRRRERSVKGRQSLDVASQGLRHEPPPVCQCSQPPEISVSSGAGVPEAQHKHTHAPASHTLFGPRGSIVQSLPPSLPHLQTILPMREQLPQEGRRQQTPKTSKRRLLAGRDGFSSQRPHEFLNWKCTYE